MKRPSPAMVVATIALFVSLSGVSYGVATGFIDSREIKNNEVRSADLRNNDIRTRDLRNNEVRGIDIRNSTVQGRDVALNTITGLDVNESTLGKVPSATAADTATSATTATSVSSLTFIPRTTVAQGAPDVTLATPGPFTLVGRCTAGSGPGDTAAAWVLARTTENDSVAGGNANDFPTMQPAHGLQTIVLLNDGPGAPTVGSSPVYGSAPSGKDFGGLIVAFADATGDTCRFSGHLALAG